MAENVKRVPYPDHPDRCQGMLGAQLAGQCTMFKSEGSQYCPLHGGNMVDLPGKSLNLYRIRKWQNRLSEFKTANGSRTLSEELALLRMILEETVNNCQSEMDLMLYSTKISDLVNDIKGLVLAADKLETKAGSLIGRTEGMVIAGKMVEIISRHVTDEKILNRMAEEISSAFVFNAISVE